MYRLILCIGLLLCSCVNTKKYGLVSIPRNQKLYKRIENGSTPSIKYFVTNKSIKAKIEEKEGFVTLSKIIDDTKIVEKRIQSDLDRGLVTSSYFAPLDLRNGTNFNTDEKLIYYEISPVFQAISIPFKYVPKENGLPYQVSTAVNTGFAYGWKFGRNSFTRTYFGNKFLNTVKRQYSITPGFFAGPTTVKLTPASTNNYISSDRTVLGWNVGVMAVIGVGKFNIGFATGWDDAWGGEGNQWIYDGSQWYGLVLALDFIK